MNNIFRNKILKLDSFPMKIEGYAEIAIEILASEGGRSLLQAGKEFYYCSEYKFDKTDEHKSEVRTEDYVAEDFTTNQLLLRAFCNAASYQGAVIDFLGIDTLVTGKGRYFDDRVALAVSRHLLGTQSGRFVRFGVCGVPISGNIGGEGIELSILEMENISGRSSSHSGSYKIENQFYFNQYLINEFGSVEYRRCDYSQTVWAPICDSENSVTRSIKVCAKSKISLFDTIKEILHILNIKCCGIYAQIDIDMDNSCEMRCRTLNSNIVSPWNSIEDAKNSALEVSIHLKKGDRSISFGTFYPRSELIWEDLTGHQYERRGHLHTTLIQSKTESVNQHIPQTFHLRDAIISPGLSFYLTLFPTAKAIRVQKVLQKENGFISETTGSRIYI